MATRLPPSTSVWSPAWQRYLAQRSGASQRPPAGFYDPSLDAQERAANRGLSQFIADTTKAGQRAESDYLLGQNQVNTQGSRSLADLLRARTREGQDYTTQRAQLGEDVATNRQRTSEDYNTNLQDLARSFQRLGMSQAQSATARGLGQGALSAAMKARAANEALARQPLDTSFQRATADIGRQEQRGYQAMDLAHSRFGEDSGLDQSRLAEDQAQALGELGRQYGYGVVDRAEAVRRAQQENTFFGQDIGAQRLYQAGQMGWTIPSRRKGKK